MRERNVVSLWLGTTSSAKSLEEYVRLGSDSEGDLVPSKFMNDFGLTSWDEDFREAATLEEDIRTIAEILEGFSYDDQLIPQFEKKIGEKVEYAVNAAVLLYNFKADPKQTEVNTEEVQLRFVGIANYAP